MLRSGGSAAYTIGNRYLVSRALGAGGMARVFLCWDTRLRVWCAVKVMAEWDTADTFLRRRFSIEARTLARLVHPNVMRIFDVVEAVRHPYLVAEYLPGGSLEPLAKSPIHPYHVLHLGMGICRALEVAHAAGIIHRDVKPANVLLDRDGQPRLGDFGIALLHDRPGSRTDTGIAGTPAYMPIEQLDGAVEPRSDLFALGMTLYVLLSGERPAALRSERREALLAANVPELLRPIIRRATQADVADRYSSAAEMAQALERAASHLVVRHVAPLPFEIREPPDRPPDGPIPGDLEALFDGTLEESERAEVRTKIGPGRSADLSRGRVVEDRVLDRVLLRSEAGATDRDALLSGARALDRIRGPGIPVVVDSGEGEAGGRWVTLGAPRGVPLQDVATSAERRTARLLPLARQACRIVAYAHRHGIAHGGIGPEQVWIDGPRVELLTGWGGTSGLAGIAQGNAEAIRDDVRALGALLAWCVQDPAPGDPVLDVVRRAQEGEYPDAGALERSLRTEPRPSGRSLGLTIQLTAAMALFGCGSFLTIGFAWLGWRGPEPVSEPFFAVTDVPMTLPPAVEPPPSPASIRTSDILAWWRSHARLVDGVSAPTGTWARFDPGVLVTGTDWETCVSDLVTHEQDCTSTFPGPRVFWRAAPPVRHGWPTGFVSFIRSLAARSSHDSAWAMADHLVRRFGPIGDYAMRDGRFAAMAGEWLVVGNELDVRIVGHVPGGRRIALGSRHVAVGDGDDIRLFDIDGRWAFDLPGSKPYLALQIEGGQLRVLRTAGVLETWSLAPPWQVVAHLRALALAPLPSGEVGLISPRGAVRLGPGGIVTPCDPGVVWDAASRDPWDVDPGGGESPGSPGRTRIQLSDGTPVIAGATRGVVLPDRTLQTEALVTALTTIGNDLLLFGDLAGGLVVWDPSEFVPRVRLELGAPVVALVATPTHLVVALADDRVLSVDPPLSALVAAEPTPSPLSPPESTDPGSR